MSTAVQGLEPLEKPISIVHINYNKVKKAATPKTRLPMNNEE